MATQNPHTCPECLDHVDRRRFFRTVGAGAAAITLGELAPSTVFAQESAPAAPNAPRPAEALCRELFTGLTAEQRQRLVLPFNHASRLRMFNAPINVRIGEVYTRPQQELVQRIMRGISSGDDGYAKLSRNGNWDTGGGFAGCGANFFGDVADGRPWTFVFSGHHLTVRCDGDSEPDTAFGGPMYYGHSPDGHSQRNVFNFQTRAVQTVYDALDDRQRRRAILSSSLDNVRIVQRRTTYPGIAASELTADQRRLVESVLRDLLAPYRREDADEAMAIIRRNGGIEQLHFGFFRDGNDSPWSYWRIDGPGIVWNYRVLPHVHCYLNVATPPRA